jgi:pimeloyl-ACP methyl ester carboxylesterase
MKRLLALIALVVGWLSLRRWLRAPGIEDPVGPLVVTADDGVRLHVEVDDGPGPTVVFVHGFTARHEEFFLQREALRGRARVVLYDQRGHGRSGWGDPSHAELDQLARDLDAVLDAHGGPGPIVLVGHSMGGMTIMALARQRPELFGERVTGVFLLATSPGDVTAHGGLGRMVNVMSRLRMLETGLRFLQVAGPVLQKLRKPGTRGGRAFVRHYLFGRDDADPELVKLVQDLLELAPFSVSAAFYPLFVTLDESASFEALRRVAVTVLVGSDDRLTPASHSEAMKDLLAPDAELVVVPGAGHSVNITRQAVVDEALLALVDRATAAGVRTA